MSYLFEHYCMNYLIYLLFIFAQSCHSTVSQSTVKSEPIQSLQDTGVVLLELFTSQGCSSCPAADEVLSQLAAKYGSNECYILLAWHVDYWDRLGWKDVFSDPYNSLRQRDYVNAFAASGVYTPQVFINSNDEYVGSDEAKILKSIKKFASKSDIELLQLHFSDGNILLHSKNLSAEGDDFRLIQVVPDSTVKILRGENKGRTFTYHNVVERQSVVTMAEGKCKIPTEWGAQTGQNYVLLWENKRTKKVKGCGKITL